MNQEKIECLECKSKNIVILSVTKTWDGDVYNVKCADCGCNFQWDDLK